MSEPHDYPRPETLTKYCARVGREPESWHCTQCHGDGELPGISHDSEPRPCPYCKGRLFGAIDVEGILKAITASRGARKGQLLQSRPPYSRGYRAYYVWRLARFHAGIDVCLPMMAYMDVRGDPYQPILDLLAETIAEKLTGHGSAGRARWQSALGTGDPDTTGMPDTARSSGPDYMGPKPAVECLEAGHQACGYDSPEDLENAVTDGRFNLEGEI